MSQDEPSEPIAGGMSTHSANLNEPTTTSASLSNRSTNRSTNSMSHMASRQPGTREAATVRRSHRLEIQRSTRATQRRARRAAILHSRRVTRQRASNSTSSDEVEIVRNHYSRMRSPRVQPTTTAPKGIIEFNSQGNNWPDTTRFKQCLLEHEYNFVCPFCDALLWHEEKRYNCCNKGEAAITPLKPINPELWDIFYSDGFRTAQRKYNGLFSFTALGAGGMEKRTWTNPAPPSMLTMHGKAYHRIFDLQERYDDMRVSNSARFYVYDSEFLGNARSMHVDLNTANTLRHHVQQSIPWARQYRAAVDEIINAPMSETCPSSGPAFIEFAEVTKSNDGPVVGQKVSAPEIAAIVYRSGDAPSSKRAVITYPKDSPDSKPRFLPLWSSCYEPLQFPMLFLHGEAGWSKGHWQEEPPMKSRTMNRSKTAHVPFLYYCRQRLLSEPIFQTNSRIAQEWACDMYSRHEENTLDYIEHSDIQQRLASQRSLQEANASDLPGKLLPGSFHGSPFKRKTDTEDALAIVNRKGRPHLMITVTCNPEWNEIADNLEHGQQACDRPDLCCRVFKIKLAEIMADLKSGKVFGPYDYHMYVVEFQKRGLPHAHIVIKFKGAGPDRLHDIDKWVWAQLPDPSIADGALREKVLKFMVHRPCGAHNPDASCMEKMSKSSMKKCTKYYPQPFRSTASINDKTGRAEYKRTDNGDNPTIRQQIERVWQDVPIGNQWIVPYNPYLLLKFNCHICVDVVTASSCVKYLFKYVTKGADMAKARISGIHNEIEQYRTTRYISAAEATWHLLGFQMINRTPAVTVVHAHLEGEQNVIFKATATQEERIQLAQDAVSDLMRYFKRPTNDIFNPLSLLDYFEAYTITKKRKGELPPSAPPTGKWLDHYGNVISSRNSSHVCRLKFQNPAVGDLFYLRLLLHSIAARSFLQLRTVFNPQGLPVVHDSFHDAARARGLVTGDEEYFICMEEASTFQVGRQLRGLFVTLILHGGPAPKLWEDFQESLTEDLRTHLTTREASAQALREIDLKLQLHGKTNEQLNLPAATHRQTEYQRMQGAFNQQGQTSYADLHEPLLTSEQRDIYETIIDAVQNDKGQPFMIDAPAGTGKTFTEKVIAARLRGEGKIVLTVASTGIAALQIPGGWTAHSMFKLPLDDNLTSGAVCNIKSETQRAELIRKCDLIIWDELPMTNKYCVEALEITLRDLMRTSNLFGGKTILFSGDWRQVGPVVKFGSASDTVEASFISSHLWPKIERKRLTLSQRDKEDASYASFVRAVGENRQANVQFPDGANLIPLSNSNDDTTTDHFNIQHTTDFEDLVRFVYPDLKEDTRLMHDRAILSTTNAAIDTSNDILAEKRAGQATTFYSSDTLISDESNPDTAFASPEHLHQLNAQGVPPHDLKLKSDSLAMLVRNLNFSEGLVNGQKGVLRGVSPNSRVIQVELLTPERPIVLVPRICFQAEVGRQGITFQRIQFPLRIAYSLTINKSQGQTLSRIGLDLRSDVFAHGQLYVALSRAQSRHSIMCLLPPSHILDGVPHVENVVYPPFVEAATGETTQDPSPTIPPVLSPPPPPPPRQWSICRELGDGSCGFRALARAILGDASRYLQIRQEIVQYLHVHRQNPISQISNGIGIKQLHAFGELSQPYMSYDHYLAYMSRPSAYMGQPEIIAAQLLYSRPIHVTFAQSQLPSLPDD